jgi:hypothetical protein
MKFFSLIIFSLIILACNSESGGNKEVTATGESGSMARFAVVDSLLIILNPGKLQTWNLSDRDDPKLMGEISVDFDVETVYAVDSILFIGSMRAMSIYSLTPPWQPQYRSRFSHWRSCDPVVVQEGKAYVTTRSGGGCGTGENRLHILDVNNIDSTFSLGSWEMSNPHGLGIDGEKLFIADGYAGLKVFNVDSTNNIDLLEVVSMEEAYDVIAKNNHLIVIAKSGLYQYDYSINPMQLLSVYEY